MNQLFNFWLRNASEICLFLFSFSVELEASEVSLNLIPLKCLIQGSACQVLKKTDMAVKVSAIRGINVCFS